MSEPRLLVASALLALSVSLAVGYVSGRSVSDLREGQVDLARQIEALRSQRGRETPEDGQRPVARGETAAVGSARAALHLPRGFDRVAEVAARRRGVKDVEVGSGIAAMRSEAIDRYERLRGKARAKALEDLGVLVALGDADARRAVLDALSDGDARVRESAIAVVAESGDAELFARLGLLTHDPSREVRQELADQLEAVPAATAGPLLMTLLDDRDPEVVEDAVKSLGAIGYEEARDRIASLLDRENLKLTGAVGETLRDFGDRAGAEDALSFLAEALEDDDAEVRRRAVKEIGQIGGDRARKYLETALEDEDFGVQQEAQKRMSRLGG